MKAALRIIGILFMVFAFRLVCVADDECDDCKVTDTCPPTPPGETMPIELGE